MLSNFSPQRDFFFKLGEALCRHRQLTSSVLLNTKVENLNRGKIRICNPRRTRDEVIL